MPLTFTEADFTEAGPDAGNFTEADFEEGFTARLGNALKSFPQALADSTGGSIRGGARAADMVREQELLTSLPTGTATPTARQSRRAFEQALTSPEYQSRLTLAGDDPAAAARVEELYGPAAKLGVIRAPIDAARSASATDATTRQSRLEQSPTYQYGQAVSDVAREVYPTRADLDDKAESQILRALGGTAPSVALGLVPFIGPPAAVAQYGLAAGEQGAQEAVAAGRPDTADIAFLANAGLGAASEAALGAAPRLLRITRAARLSGIAPEKFKATLDVWAKANPIKASALEVAIREGAQESVEQAGQNVIARDVAGYDPDRPYSKDVVRAGVLGATTGLLLGGGGAGLRRLTQPSAKASAQPFTAEDFTPDRSELDAALTELQAPVPQGEGDRAGIEAAPPELIVEPPVIKEYLTTEPKPTPEQLMARENVRAMQELRALKAQRAAAAPTDSPATITGSNVQQGTAMPAEAGEAPVGSPIPAPEISVPPAIGNPQSAILKGRPFLSPRADGIPDILDAVQELGGIKPPGTQQGKGEYDGYAAAFHNGPARVLVGGRHRPDTLISELQGMGWRYETPDQLYQAVQSASAQRDALTRAEKLDRTIRDGTAARMADLHEQALDAGITHEQLGEVEAGLTTKERQAFREDIRKLRTLAGVAVDTKADPDWTGGLISGSAAEQWADETIKQSRKRVQTGVDPELLFAYAVKGTALLERGVRDFGAWSADMVRAFGESVRPHLQELFERSRRRLTGVRAHHGTPHAIQARFSTDKIGTGEGAQVYGWGLYFAENEAVATEYRNALRHKAKDKQGDTIRRVLPGVSDDALHAIADHAEERNTRMAKARSSELRPLTDGKLLEAMEAYTQWQGGNEYTVTLDVEPEELLDWDKPLSEQSEKVKAALSTALAKRPEMTGGELYNAFAGSGRLVPHLNGGFAFAKQASETLLRKGIPGIRYLDQGSRGNLRAYKMGGDWRVLRGNNPLDGKFEGGVFKSKASAERYVASQSTYNYVIFDDSRVHITHENAKPRDAFEAALDRAKAELREAWNDLGKMGIVSDPKADAQKMFNFYKALFKLARAYAAKGMATAQDFATALGLKLNAVVQAAWDDAKANTPKTSALQLDPGAVADAADEFKQRKFSARFAEDERMDPDVRAATGNDRYQPIPNQFTVVEALNYVQEHGPDAALALMKDETNRDMPDRVRVTLGQAIIAKANHEYARTKSEAALDRAVDTAEWLTEYGTRLGQGVQAFAIWSRMTPEGFVRAAVRAVKKAQVKKPGLKIPDVDGKTKKEIHKQASDALKKPEGFQRDEDLADVLARIARLKGVNKLDVALALWYGNILSGWTTQVRNLAGNLTNTLAEFSAHAAIRPQRIPSMLAGLYNGALRGAFDGANVLRTGKVTGTRVGKLEAPRALELVKFRGAAYPLNAWKYVFRVMAATDMVFFRSSEEMKAQFLARELARTEGLRGAALSARVGELLNGTAGHRQHAEAQAKAEGLTGLARQRRIGEIIEQGRPATLVQEAADHGRLATFNQDPQGVMGALASAINQASHRFVPLRLVVPFTRVVANVTNGALNFTPWGYRRLFPSAFLDTNWMDEQATPAHYQLQAARATLGTIGLVTLYALAQSHADDDDPDFTITALGPQNPNDRNQLRETGWKPHTVKIGDRYISYKETPLHLGLALVGSLLDAVRYKKLDERDALTRFSYALHQVGNTILSQSFLSSLGQFFEGLSNDRVPRGGQQFTGLARTATSMVIPNLAKQLDKLFDPTIYSGTTVQAALLRDVPIARRGLDPMLNVLGEPVKTDLNPFLSARKEDDLWHVLARQQAFISTPSKSMMVGDRAITPEEYYDLVRVRGQWLGGQLRKPEILYLLSTGTPERAQLYVERYSDAATTYARARLKLRPKTPAGAVRPTTLQP